MDPASILIFGCGTSSSPYVTAVYFPQCTVQAYDRNKEKIRLARNRGLQHMHVEYSDKKPNRTFDVVLGLAVIHEDTLSISREIASYAKVGGYVRIIDYAMKGMDIGEFFSRWGQLKSEFRERRLLGDKQAHKIHTRLGLEDCLGLMDQAGFNTKLAIPKVVRQWGGGLTIHFIYLGQRVC